MTKRAFCTGRGDKSSEPPKANTPLEKASVAAAAALYECARGCISGTGQNPTTRHMNKVCSLSNVTLVLLRTTRVFVLLFVMRDRRQLASNYNNIGTMGALSCKCLVRTPQDSHIMGFSTEREAARTILGSGHWAVKTPPPRSATRPIRQRARRGYNHTYHSCSWLSTRVCVCYLSGPTLRQSHYAVI